MLSNFKHFELERQTEGRTFGIIATIKLNTANQYSYLDNEQLPGNNFYRLKMVDNDGKFTYSKTVVVVNTINGFAISSVYPTITNGNVIVEGFASAKSTLTSNVFSLSGQKVLEQSNSIEQNFKQNIDISKLANGSYVLMLSNGTSQTSYKIIKQ